MSLPAQNPSQSFLAAAGQTIFPFTWRADSSGVVSAYINDIVQGGYAINLNVDQVNTPGGSITFDSPLNNGDAVTIERVNPLTQTVALTAYQPFSAAAVVAALDRVMEILQEFETGLIRAFKVSRANAATMVSLELPAPQAGTFLAWAKNNTNKYFLTNAVVSSGVPIAVLGVALQTADAGATWTDALGRAPTNSALYLNGQRIFQGPDYTYANGIWTLTTPAIPSENTLNADLFL